jgi:hypothetical protein
MSRQTFLKNVMKGPKGESSSQENLDFWSNRATANSKCAPHASDGPMKLPSTKVSNRDTSMKPYKSQADSMVKEALADIDIVGSKPFMPKVRRNG